MDVWGFELSSIPYYSLMSLVTFRKISYSLFYVTMVRPGLQSTEVTEAPPPGPASHHPGPVRGLSSLDFDFCPNMEEVFRIIQCL